MADNSESEEKKIILDSNQYSFPEKINSFKASAVTLSPEFQPSSPNDLQNTNTEGENGEKYIDSNQYWENQTRVKEFLKYSIHMDAEFSGSSSDYTQGDVKHDNDETDDSESSSNEDDTQCDICQKIFLDQKDYNQHIRSRRMGDKRYKCCNCGKTFRDNTQLKVHARKHTGEKPFECDICQKKFTVNGNLNKHMRIHTGEKRFECSECGRKFTQLAHLEDHLKTHSGERPFVCGYCQAAFKTKARLRKHEKSHTDNKPSKRAVSCPKCKIILKSNRQLATHLATHVQDGDGPFVCHFCGKTFSKYTNLQQHQKNHADLKIFNCQFCERVFSNASHLKRHMNSHSGYRPYSCEVCKRAFPSSQNMKRHMMIHTGEKPFICTECDRGFLTLENLNRHKRTHTGEKPFACEICGKLFAHSTTAKEHFRTVHTGEKPFACRLCPKAFAISKMLFKHTRERHPDYFPQFKAQQNLTPNMKMAQARIQMTIKYEDEIKTEDVSDNTLQAKVKEEPMCNEDTADNSFEAGEDTKCIQTSGIDDTKLKSEKLDEMDYGKKVSIKVEPEACERNNEKHVKVENNEKTLETNFQNEEVFVKEDIDIPFVKIEKQDDDNF